MEVLEKYMESEQKWRQARVNGVMTQKACSLNIIAMRGFFGGEVWTMLEGRQLYLLRTRKSISRDRLGAELGLQGNDLIVYENGIRSIPDELYNRWVKIIKALQ